ncbi:MAG TPA: glycosyltransferase family 4 protein [Herpetosiphonaceae bacterium]
MRDRSPARPLRIAFLDSWLQTSVEGSGTAVGITGLEQGLQQQSHHIDRIAPSPDRLSITLRRLLFNLKLPLRLRRAAYHLVVGFDFDGVWLPRGNWPYVCSIKGIIAEELQHERGLVRLIFTLLSRLEGSNARRADRVVTTSEYCRRKIVQHYDVSPERIGIVPEGIDVRAWQAALAQTPPRADSRPTILCVARHYPRKHVDDLLRAFALLRRHLPEARLRIVGDGPEHQKLLALAQELRITDAATFLGGIPDAEVKAEYAHCDVFCMPSVQEGFGIVFLEAMASGLPVVSTTAAAIPEVVRHGESGILLPPGDVVGIAGALLLLLTDHQRRAQYGQAGRAIVADYDWTRVTEMFLGEITPLV